MFKIIKLKKVLFPIFSLILVFAILSIFNYSRDNIPVSASESKQPTVYLTFDDGPSAVTEKVLDILQRENVKATFFVIGATTDRGINMYNRMANEGHEIALHSYTHDTRKIYSSIDNFFNDLNELEDLIYEVTELSPTIHRFPGGSSTTECDKYLMQELKKTLAERGYTSFDWDVDPKDSGSFALNSKNLFENVQREAEKKPNQDLIILMHDDGLRTTLPTALEDMIIYFKQNNYKFDVLSNKK